MTGQFAQSRTTIDATIALVERNGDLFMMPELLRIKGDILSVEPDYAQAEAVLLQSLEMASRQGALSWELRAATSLARLRSRQGRFEAARDALTVVHGRFSEGIKTSDCEAAVLLIRELAGAAAAE